MSRSWNLFGLAAFVSVAAVGGCTITSGDSGSSGGSGGEAGSDTGGAATDGGATSAAGGTGGQGGTSTEGGATSTSALEEAVTQTCALDAFVQCHGTSGGCESDWTDYVGQFPSCESEFLAYFACVNALESSLLSCEDAVVADSCSTEETAMNDCAVQ